MKKIKNLFLTCAKPLALFCVLTLNVGTVNAEYWQLRAKVVLSGGGEPKSTVWVGGYSQSAGTGSADYTMPAPASDWYSGNPDTRMCVNPAGGEEFIGWYSDEECTQSFSSTTCGNVYGAKLAFVSRAAAAADVQITTIYAKFMPAAADWQSLAEAPTAGNYYIYGYGYGGLAGLYEYSDGKVVKGTKDPNQAVLFTLSDGTNPKISCVDEGVTKYVNHQGNYIKPEEFPAKTLVAMGDGTYMVNLNNGHSGGYTWWEMRSDGGCTYSTKNESSNTERWLFIPEAAYNNLVSVESLKETGSITINSAPTVSGKTNVKFNVSDIGPVSAFECTISGGDGNFVLGDPTRKDNVITVPITYTAHNVHSGTSTPLTTATVTLTAKNDAATSASGTVPVYVDLQPKFALNVNALDWSYDGETLVETYYAGMEVAASQRDRLTNKLVYDSEQTTGVAADYATWTATITGANADQFKFANGTQTVTGPYTPELLDVIFAPTATGEMNATLHIVASYAASNETLTWTRDIPLKGKAETVSVITFAADGNQSPSAAESHNFGDIIGTNAKEVTADLFIAGITNPTKVWSDPDGAFEFDVNTVDLTKTNQTLTFRAHHAIPLEQEKNHIATLTISGQGTEGPVSAVLTLTYHALPLITPTVTWNWEYLDEYTTATNPVTTNSDGAWVLTKIAGDKVTYDAETKTATTAYLHHEPGYTATFSLTIPQTDTYAAFSQTYVSTISPVDPAPIYINSQEMFDTYVEGNSWVTYDASKNAVHINLDNAYFKFSGQTVFAFDYSGYTRNTKLTEIYADGTQREIYNDNMAEGHYEIPISPNIVKLHLYGSNDFINVHYYNRDAITVNYDLATLVKDNTTIGSLDLRAKFEGKQRATVALSAAAKNYFELRTEGKVSGSSLVFDENDGMGVYSSEEKVITLAMKDGADIAAAKQAADNNECFITFADGYTYNHEEKIVPIALIDAYDITFKHNEHGSYKVQYKLDAEATTITATDNVEHRTTVDPELCTVTMFEPAPENGYLFQGWMINGELVSCKSSITKMFTAETVVEPIFTFVEGVYRVDDAYYGELSEALAVAGSIADQNPVVTLMKDVVLEEPATYTIPAGVTLLIPYKANFGELQIIPEITTTATVLSAYRTLTLKEGVNIICNGNICVSGKIMSAGGGNKSSYTTGECGVINMANGGHIELNDGAELYCWGYIKGQDMDQGNNTQGVGTVTVNSGAVVHENFELGDWRGGTASSNIYAESEKMLFPFQSYALQNVEIPTTYKYGSKLATFMVVNTGFGAVPFAVDVLGSEQTLFLLKDEGSIIRKWYDPTTDLSCYELSGTAQLDALVMNLPFVGDFNSGECNLPISNSMHIILANCDMTLAKPLTVQAGAVLEIKNTATVNLEANIHLFDVDDWGLYIHNYYFRSFNNLTSHKNRGAENSKAGLEDAKFIIDGTLNVKSGKGYIYSTAGGANLMGNGGGVINFLGALPSADEIWHVNVLSASPYITWVSNSEAAANLCNEDGSYTRSIENAAFYNIHGRWFHEEDKNEQPDHTYNFTYMVDDTPENDIVVNAVYSHDKTGLEERMKWFNVTPDANCPKNPDPEADLESDWWTGTNPEAYYNYTMLGEWHQFMAAEGEGVYSGSNNVLYRKADCDWAEEGFIDENCLYTIDGVNKALVDGHFIPLTSNGYDPAYHATANASQYYICFTGCNWHPATPYAGESKAYTIHPEDKDLYYIWFNNDWMNVEREEPFFYTADEQTNVKTYYEYVNGEWEVATPFVRVEDALETREFYMIKEAFNVASIKKNATITILRDIPNVTESLVYTTQNTTCTLDLNGHIVTGSCANLLNINAPGSTFTITDNSEYKNGELRAMPSANSRQVGYTITAGTLKLEEGKMYATNAMERVSSSVNPNVRITSIVVAAGATFNMTGGVVESVDEYNNYGISINATSSTKGVMNMSGGRVIVHATKWDSPYGILVNYGKLNLSGDAYIECVAEKSSTSYGVSVQASSYPGEFNMTGGTVYSKAYTSSARGVQVNGTATVTGDYNAATPDNTPKARYYAKAKISGGTIIAETETTTSPFGVLSYGTTEISGGTITSTVLKSDQNTAYGVRVLGGTTTINEGVTVTANAPKTSYALSCSAANGDSNRGWHHDGVLIVNGGSFTANATVSTTAYGLYVSGSTYNINKNNGYSVFNGDYACAGNATVNGGEFVANAKTNTAIGIVVDKTVTKNAASATPVCTINGGKFKMTGESALNGANTAAQAANFKINGGIYSHEGNLATYANAETNKIVVTLPKTDTNYPDYKYEVAEGFTITFKNGEETLQTTAQKVGTTPTYNGIEPTKEGTSEKSYIFDGWSATKDGELTTITPVSEEVTYYAHFNETTLKYRLTLDAKTNGGIEETQIIYVDPASAVGTLPIPTKAGYHFEGWYSVAAPTGGTKLEESTVINANGTYYARFAINQHTLTWNLDGGKVTKAGTQAAKDAEGSPNGLVDYKATITAPVVAKTGYVFKNWGVSVVATTMPDDDLTYTATWSPATNTPYVVKHMQENLATGDFNEAESENLTGTTGTYVTPKTKSYPGYVTPAAQTVQILADGSQVVTYNYSLINYTITLDANGGTCATTSVNVKHGATLTLPVATKEGVNCSGWFTKPIGGDKITDETAILYHIGTLYAQYDALNVTAPLTISEDRAVTDLRITTTGSLTIAGSAEVTVTVNNFILESNGATASGQLLAGFDKLTYEHAYFDMKLNAKNHQWYAVAVPWQVNAETGISVSGRTLKLGKDFDIIYYNGEQRAQQGKQKCWSYVEDDGDKTLVPGRLYMIGLMSDAQTVRFEQATGASLSTTTTSVAAHASSTGDETDKGWNGVANPALFHAFVNPGVTEGQVYVPDQKRYETVTLNTTKFVVGEGAFVQVESDKNITVVKDGAFAAPRRTHAQANLTYDVRIAPAEGAYTDRLFIKTTDNREADFYTVGQDLAKVGVSSIVPQMWINRYDAKLCVNTQELANETADYPLGISIPQAGEYTISQESMAETGNYTLYLTYNGEVVWNLSDGAYTFSLPQGETMGYGLRIVAKTPSVATGVDEALIDAQGNTQKVLIDNKVYIIRGNNVYSADGQLVK